MKTKHGQDDHQPIAKNSNSSESEYSADFCSISDLDWDKRIFKKSKRKYLLTEYQT